MRQMSFFVLFFLTFLAQAQDKFLVLEGKFTLDPALPDPPVILVSKTTGGGSDRVQVNPDGNYTIRLDFQKEYKILYSRKGYVPQFIVVNTNVDKERIADAFYPKDFNVKLFEDVPGLNTTEITTKPVGKIFYQEDLNDFEWDEGYTAAMREQLETLRAEVNSQKEKNKLNALSAADLEKQKAAEAERLKLETAAKKKAEEEALAAEKLRKGIELAEAKAKREAEELARREKESADARAKREADEKAKAEANAAEKARKEKELADARAKREADEKAKAEADAAEKARKEKELADARAKREANEKARIEAVETERKAKEAALAEEARLKREKELADAKRIREELASQKEQMKLKAEEMEKARLDELAKQEELFKAKRGSFKPVMGVYSGAAVKSIGEKKAYGYINFGNGLGNQDLTKEEYDAYAEKYLKKP